MAEAYTPFLVTPREGFTPRIGLLAAELESSRHYLLRASRELTVAQLDAAPGTARNTMGELLAHVDAAENLFQRITFEDRMFNDEEKARYSAVFEFAFDSGGRPRGRTIESCHAQLAETRARTLEGLRRQDDAWLDTPRTFSKQPSNTFYYWLHLLMDEARHTGQLILIRKHLVDGADPAFMPYGF
jgi:hypothetical protein